MNPAPPISGEDGFTLVELLMAIAIIGVIVPVIAAVITVGVRDFGITANRIASSHDAQLVALYLPADMQSAGGVASDVVFNKATGSCSGAPSVLELAWTQQTITGTFVADYVVTTSGSERRLVRWYCDPTVNSGTPHTTVLARNLTAGNPVCPGQASGPVCPSGSGEAPPVRVTLTITENATNLDTLAYTYSVEGIRRTQ